MAEARLSVRVDQDVKDQAKAVYARMGMDLSTAVNVFLVQSVHDNAMPFRPSLESAESAEARRQADAGEGKRYSSVAALMADLNA